MSAPPRRARAPEDELLVALTAPHAGPERIELLLRGDLEWDTVLDGAARHNVLALLPAVLDLPVAPETVPAPVAQRLRAIRKGAEFTDMLRSAVLRGLTDEFRVAGVPVMLLKGQGLAERYYTLPGERTSTDIDLLVPRGLLPAASRVLERGGYVASDREHYEQTHFHIPFVHGERRHHRIVELHWDVAPAHSILKFDVADWWGRARPLVTRSGEMLVPSAADEFIHLAWHALNNGTVVLRDLSDIARIAAAEESRSIWDDVRERGERAQAAGFVRQALELCAAIWCVPAPLPGFVREGPRPVRRIGRWFFLPEVVLKTGPRRWWPLRQIAYWSLLPRRRAGLRELFRRGARAIREDHRGDGPLSRGIAELRGLSTLVVALLLCVVRSLVPAARPYTGSGGGGRG